MASPQLDRARLSLQGLAVGDAYGGWCLMSVDCLPPRQTWRYSDDTEMAISIVEILERFDSINQDELAQAFARRYAADPYRGYAHGARALLERVAAGESWKTAAKESFGGMGSYGNGSAMRVAPVGAFFADDPGEAIQAMASVLGDTDTNCAIVGGIVILANGAGSIPQEWSLACEAPLMP